MDSVEQRDLASTPTAFAVWHQQVALVGVVDRKTRRLREALEEIRGLHESLTAKSAELELAARSQRAIVEALDARICILDHAGSTAVQNDFWHAFATTDKAVRAAVHGILAGSVEVVVLQSACRGPDGRWYQVRVCPLPAAEHGRVMVAYLDNTDLVGAERALVAKSEEAAMLALVARHMESAVLICDARGYVEWTNESFTQQTGYAFAEAVGQAALELLVAPDAVRDLGERIRSRLVLAEPFSAEIKHTARDGRVYPAEIDIRPVTADDGSLWRTVAILRDVSARNAAEVRLAQAERLESMGEMAAGVAHEINTPMQYIGDNLTFLRRALEVGLPLVTMLDGPDFDHAKAIELASNSRFRFIMERIPSAIDHALEGVAAVSKIVGAMQAFSRFGGGDVRALTDVNACVEMALTFSRSAWKYIAEVETRLAPDLPLIEADGGEINQVILNLILNAAHAVGDAAKDGALGTITVTTRHDADCVVLEVADTGHGIPPEIIGRVFDPFFTTKEVGKGTGQGLTLAHTIVVKRHGGTIDVSSSPGHDTIFTVRLPIGGGGSAEGTAA